MSKLAIVYATTEGHTTKVASYIAARMRDQGHEVEQHQVDELYDFAPQYFDGVLIGGSIHEGRYQRQLERWITEQRDDLCEVATGLFTVCLAIQSENDKEREAARAFPMQLSERTGWKPDQASIFAGALKYTQYSWLKRALMKQIAKREGASTDISTDHEYTRWSDVDAFTDRFLSRLQNVRSQAS